MSAATVTDVARSVAAVDKSHNRLGLSRHESTHVVAPSRQLNPGQDQQARSHRHGYAHGYGRGFWRPWQR